MMFKKDAPVVKLDYINEHNHWHLISGYDNSGRIRRTKHIHKKRGNCYFARGVKLQMADFIYRAVKKLRLTGCDLVFSKGAVKHKNRASNTYCSYYKLPWLNALSIKIPQRLAYEKMLTLDFGGEKHSLRQMELLVLGTLLTIRYPGKSAAWCSKTAAGIIVRGWVFLDEFK